MSLVYAFFADGFEEVEGIAVIDVLRRARVDVKTVSIKETREVTTSHNITILTDLTLKDINIDDADVLFMPGGLKGTENLYACKEVTDALLRFFEQGKRIAAICAAPSILGKLGIMEGKRATVYPGFEKEMKGAVCTGEKVVTDGTITTAKGMGASIELGLEMVSLLENKELADTISKQIQFTV